MKTLDDLKEKAAKENSLKAMTEYRDAITDELKFGKEHLKKLYGVSSSNPKKEVALDSCKKKISNLEEKLKSADSMMSIYLFDKMIELREKKRKLRNIALILTVTGFATFLVFI
jgi:hypothetical protein